LKPRHTAQKLLGQNPKKKNVLSILEKIHPRENQKSKEHFSLVSTEALRGGGGTDSFVQFPLEKGSRKVYNYSTKLKYYYKKSAHLLAFFVLIKKTWKAMILLSTPESKG